MQQNSWKVKKKKKSPEGAAADVRDVCMQK